MREQVYVGVSVGRESPQDWRLLVQSEFAPLIPVETKEFRSGAGYEYKFDYYPEDLEEVQKRLKAQQIDSFVRVGRSYTLRELKQAEFLILNYRSVVYSTKSNPLYRSEPQLICPHCGFQEATWNLPDTEVMGKDHRYKVASLDWNPTVISRDLAIELEKASLSGLTLTPVGCKTPPEWYGLSSTNILSSMQVPPTRLIFGRGRTPECKSNHMIEEWRSEFFYERGGFNGLDFNSTYEVFGDRRGGARLTIISGRVYQLLVKLGVKHLKCEPIRFVD